MFERKNIQKTIVRNIKWRGITNNLMNDPEVIDNHVMDNDIMDFVTIGRQNWLIMKWNTTKSFLIDSNASLRMSSISVGSEKSIESFKCIESDLNWMNKRFDTHLKFDVELSLNISQIIRNEELRIDCIIVKKLV